jgi:CheY-like chemotaxis protein
MAAPRALARVLDEVLSNALAFGAVRVQLSGHAAYGRVRLEFANDGSTPSEEVAANATKPFFTTRAAAGNRGLGLAIAAGLLRDQDGHLELSPAAGGGALVTVTLPTVEEMETASVSVAGGGTGRVLVVEDTPMVSELIAEGLRERGWEVSCVGTYMAAREAAAGSWDALIIDQHLPDGSGLDLARELSGRFRGRIALMTGDVAALEGRTEGLPLLGKPFRIDVVASLVASLALR